MACSRSSCDVDVEDVHDRPAEADRSRERDGQRAAEHVDVHAEHRRGPAGAQRRRPRMRRCRTTASPPRPAPRPASRGGRRRARDELDVRPMREARVVFEHRAVHRRPGPTPDRRRRARSAGCPCRPRRPVEGVTRDGFEVERIVDRDRDLRRVERHRAHVDLGADDLAPRRGRARIVRTPAGGVDRELGRRRRARQRGDPRETADPVPAHLRARRRRRSPTSSCSRRRCCPVGA